MARGLLMAALASVHLLMSHALLNKQKLGSDGSEDALQTPARFSGDFAACDEPVPCGRDGLPSRYLLDILRNVGPTMERVAAAGRTPTLLHIGAATFGNDASFSDVDLYSKVISLLSDSVRASSKLVLVEPNELCFPYIQLEAKKLPLDLSRQVQVVHGMVTDSCGEASKTMYRFSRQAEADFGVPWVIYGTWVSFIPTHPVHVLSIVVGQREWFLQNPEAWRRFHDAANVTDYVERFEVPCYSPATLAEKIGILPSDLAMVVIDAEQADSRIIGKMIEMPGFKPGYLQWEGNPRVSRDVENSAKSVQGLGFKVGSVFSTAANGDANNLVAFPVN